MFEWTIVTVFFWHYAKDNASKSAAKKLKFLYTLKLIPSCMQFLNRTLASTRHVVGFSCVQKLHKWECPFQKWWKNFQFLYIFFCIFTLFLSCFANFWKIASLSSYPWICSNLDWFGGNWILESTYNLWKLGKFLNGRTEVSLKNSFLVPYFSGKFRTLTNNYDKAFFKKKS